METINPMKRTDVLIIPTRTRNISITFRLSNNFQEVSNQLITSFGDWYSQSNNLCRDSHSIYAMLPDVVGTFLRRLGSPYSSITLGCNICGFPHACVFVRMPKLEP